MEVGASRKLIHTPFPGPVNHRWIFNSTHWQAVYFDEFCCTCGNMTGTGYPGALTEAMAWTETGSSGALMLFGGLGHEALRGGDCSYDYLNDLYVNFVHFQGKVVTGAGKIGVYGTRGIFNTSNWPGGRKNALVWSDRHGNHYIYGGYGFGSTGTPGYLGDVWRWSPVNGGFTWVAGPEQSNRPAQKGAYGETSLNYYPACRHSSHVWEVSPFDVVWIFGEADADSASGGGLFDMLRLTFILVQVAPHIRQETAPTTCGSSICAKHSEEHLNLWGLQRLASPAQESQSFRCMEPRSLSQGQAPGTVAHSGVRGMGQRSFCLEGMEMRTE